MYGKINNKECANRNKVFAMLNTGSERTNIFIYYIYIFVLSLHVLNIYEGWNFNSGNYLFTNDTK